MNLLPIETRDTLAALKRELDYYGCMKPMPKATQRLYLTSVAEKLAALQQEIQDELSLF